jgi:hypothetical protein
MNVRKCKPLADSRPPKVALGITNGSKKQVQNYDLRVAARIQRSATMSACDYIELQTTRRIWIKKMEAAMQG